MVGRKRLSSLAEVKAAEATGNLNVEWMSEKHWWPTYLALIVGLRLLIFYFAPYLDQPGQWTLTHVSHAAVSGAPSPRGAGGRRACRGASGRRARSRRRWPRGRSARNPRSSDVEPPPARPPRRAHAPTASRHHPRPPPPPPPACRSASGRSTGTAAAPCGRTRASTWTRPCGSRCARVGERGLLPQRRQEGNMRSARGRRRTRLPTSHRRRIATPPARAPQIDNGVPWTDTKKFFMIVSIVL